MNTNTTTAPISLSRVLNGYYSYNHVTATTWTHFEVIRQGAGLWSVKRDQAAAWLVGSLDEARALIASEIA